MGLALEGQLFSPTLPLPIRTPRGGLAAGGAKEQVAMRTRIPDRVRIKTRCPPGRSRSDSQIKSNEINVISLWLLLLVIGLEPLLVTVFFFFSFFFSVRG